MEYAYKPTTNGRAVMAACMALEKPLHITRVAFGGGLVDESVNLADVHALQEYVSDGAMAERRHQDDRLFLTIQYANSAHEDVPTFFLSEFMVFAEDPETGEETDLLYGTLGDYRLPVPAYHPAYPPSVFNFPLELILSDEIQVSSSAALGLVSWEDLTRHMEDPHAHPGLLARIHAAETAINGAETLVIPAGNPTAATAGAKGQYSINLDTGEIFVCGGAMDDGGYLWTPAEQGASLRTMLEAAEDAASKAQETAESIAQSITDLETKVEASAAPPQRIGLTIPVEGWEEDGDAGGLFAMHVDIVCEESAESLSPMLTILPAYLEAAGDCGLCPAMQTMDGAVRIYAREPPSEPLEAVLTLLGAAAGSLFSLPAASSDTLGGVMVRPGSGLVVDGSGNLSLDAAAGKEVEALFDDSNG